MRRTVDRLLKEKQTITIFRKLVYHKNSIICWDETTYEVFEGNFMNYQLPVRHNEKVHFVGWNKPTEK